MEPPTYPLQRGFSFTGMQNTFRKEHQAQPNILVKITIPTPEWFRHVGGIPLLTKPTIFYEKKNNLRSVAQIFALPLSGGGIAAHVQ